MKKVFLFCALILSSPTSAFAETNTNMEENREILQYVQTKYGGIDNFKENVCAKEARARLHAALSYRFDEGEERMEHALDTYVLEQTGGRYSRESDVYKAKWRAAIPYFKHAYATNAVRERIFQTGILGCWEERILSENNRKILDMARQALKQQQGLAQAE